jgi:hypothetical protein
MIMSEPLENLYFNWLCAKVIYIRNHTPSTMYWKLLSTLHKTEFAWFLWCDDNRAEDGLVLRKEFLRTADIPGQEEWLRIPPCSVLEMLIAFSRRAEFQTADPARTWFWEFIDNLGLKYAHDGSDTTVEEIQDILDQFIWRTYGYDGRGGLFPLDDPRRDQREVEIWYQFCDYLRDQDRMP